MAGTSMHSKVSIDVAPEVPQALKGRYRNDTPGRNNWAFAKAWNYASLAGWMETKLDPTGLQDQADVVRVIK